MAKSPGPAIAMAAAAALFLLSRGGSDDSDSTPDKDWEPPAPDDDGTTTTEETGQSKPSTGGTGGGTASNPPNLSNDPKGYNTTLWTSPRAARSALLQIGYPIPQTDEALVKKPLVKSFQRHYNWVHENPSVNIGGPFTASDLGVKGFLLVDGTAGKHTLNALEAAMKKTSLWDEYIASAEAAYPSGSDWGYANGPCSVSFSNDHDSLMKHSGISGAASALLSAALEAKNDSPLTITTQNGLRGASEPNGPDVIPHDHKMNISVDDLKALSRGETVTITTDGPDDGDDDHKHSVVIRNC